MIERRKTDARRARAARLSAPLCGFSPQQVGLLLGYGQGIKFAGSGRTEGHQVGS